MNPTKDAVAHLADLLRERNHIDEQIAGGEWISEQTLGVKLHDSAIHPASDGHFTQPPFAGRTVQVKTYLTRTNVLDMNKPGQPQPDYYLAITGPKSSSGTSRGCTHPFVLREVFLFETAPLVQRLEGRVKNIGTSTSVRKQEWEDARIYPVIGEAGRMQLLPDQVEALTLLRGD